MIGLSLRVRISRHVQWSFTCLHCIKHQETLKFITSHISLIAFREIILSHEHNNPLIMGFPIYVGENPCSALWTFRQVIVHYQSVLVAKSSFGKRPSRSCLVMMFLLPLFVSLCSNKQASCLHNINLLPNTYG